MTAWMPCPIDRTPVRTEESTEDGRYRGRDGLPGFDPEGPPSCREEKR